MSLKIVEFTGTYESTLPQPREWKPMSEIEALKKAKGTIIQTFVVGEPMRPGDIVEVGERGILRKINPPESKPKTRGQEIAEKEADINYSTNMLRLGGQWIYLAPTDRGCVIGQFKHNLAAIIDTAVADEREACAKIADQYSGKPGGVILFSEIDVVASPQAMALHIAADIRKRKP